MSAQTRLVALLALCWFGPATAQAAGGAWIDPPARGVAAAPVPQSEPEVPKGVETKAHAVRPSGTRVAVVRRPPGPTVRTHARPPARNALGRIAHARGVQARVARARGAMPAHPVRSGFLAPPPPPDMHGGDPRLRWAEAAGYLVVRRSAFATRDGRILYGYRPYDPYD